MFRGDNIVYVPMIGNNSVQGVIELHGLHAEGITSPKIFERSGTALRAMIGAKDYK